MYLINDSSPFSDSNGPTWASDSPTNALLTPRRWGRRFLRRNARPTSTETTPRSLDVCSNDQKTTTRIRTNRRTDSTNSARKKLTTFCGARRTKTTTHLRHPKPIIRQIRRARRRKPKTRSDTRSKRRLLTPKLAKVRRAKRTRTRCRLKGPRRKGLEPEAPIGKISFKAFSDPKPDFSFSNRTPLVLKLLKTFCALHQGFSLSHLYLGCNPP